MTTMTPSGDLSGAREAGPGDISQGLPKVPPMPVDFPADPSLYGDKPSADFVTYAMVAEACNALVQTGVTPSIRSIRRHLGTGSHSTISKHLRTWVASHGAQPDLDTPPDGITKALWMAAVQSAMKAVQHRSGTQKTALETALMEIDSLLSAQEQSEATIAALRDQLTAAAMAQDEVRRERDRARADAASAEAQVSSLRKQVEALRVSLAANEVELAACREQRDGAASAMAVAHHRIATQDEQMHRLGEALDRAQAATKEAAMTTAGALEVLHHQVVASAEGNRAALEASAAETRLVILGAVKERNQVGALYREILRLRKQSVPTSLFSTEHRKSTNNKSR